MKYQCSIHLTKAKQLLLNGANTLESLNEIQIELDAVSGLSQLMSQVHPSKKIRDEAENCEQDSKRFLTELSLNKSLYKVLASINPQKLDSVARRMLDKSLQDFTAKAEIQSVQQELVLISQEFSRNIREDTRYIEVKDLKGLPEYYLKSHPISQNGLIKVTTDDSDYVPFMTYADNMSARELLWRKSNNLGYPANETILNQLLQKRYELSRLLGYKSYADYIIEGEMIKTAAHVEAFIDKISRISKKGADKEYALLLDEKRRTQPKAKKVFAYEFSYLNEKYKQRRYHLDSQEVRHYFQFNKVRDGLLSLTEDLFGIRYKQIKDADVWHKDVLVYDVYDKAELLGRIYLDLHPRDHKEKGNHQLSLQSGVKNRQIPEGVLVCNFENDLMTHRQVADFFHEFGHLLHHIMSGQQKWILFSGLSTEGDFIEVPSLLFEEWAWEPQVLRRFAKHEKTGEPISAELVSRMRAAAEFGKGINTREQMFYSAISLQYHRKKPSLKTLQTRYSQFPYVDGIHPDLSFIHLYDYSAKYYTYMWSQVIAKDLLIQFKSAGMLNPDVARRYRRTILEPGGSKDANDLVRDFLGRPYSFDAFMRD